MFRALIFSAAAAGLFAGLLTAGYQLAVVRPGFHVDGAAQLLDAAFKIEVGGPGRTREWRAHRRWLRSLLPAYRACPDSRTRTRSDSA